MQETPKKLNIPNVSHMNTR